MSTEGSPVDARAHLQRMKEAGPAERFAAAGQLLFGTEDARDLLWTHSATLLDTPDAVLRVLRLLARAPFAPCFHVINHTQIFLPFGTKTPDAALVFIDCAKFPRAVSLPFAPLAPTLQTRRWSPAHHDSEVVPWHDEIDPAAWEPHRRPLLEHYVARVLADASDPAAVRRIVEPLINK